MTNTPRRIVDRDAMRTALLVWRSCSACGQPGSNAHHVIPKGYAHGYGDDVLANLIVVCGSGTSGCHGALHGSPYTDRSGRRWTQEDVEQAIGAAIGSGRPDTVRYVIGKLGDTAGREYLRRRYHLEA